MSVDESPSAHPSFRSVFDEHWPFVWRVLHYLGLRGADVEDQAQEVFMVVLRRLPEFDVRRPMRPWLSGICRNVGLGHKRTAHVRREIASETLADEPGWTDQVQLMEDRDAVRRLARVLDSLPEEQRVAFLLHQVEQMPMSEVVEVLECPLQTGYSRYNAALRHIRSALSPGAEESMDHV